MIKIATTVGVTVLFALTGCTSGESDGGTFNPAPTETPMSADERYISNLESEMPEFKGADKDALVEAGHMVCDYFEDFGVSETSLLVIIEGFEPNFTTDETATIVYVATDSYCPGIKDDILELAEGGNI